MCVCAHGMRVQVRKVCLTADWPNASACQEGLCTCSKRSASALLPDARLGQNPRRGEIRLVRATTVAPCPNDNGGHDVRAAKIDFDPLVGTITGVPIFLAIACCLGVPSLVGSASVGEETLVVITMASRAHINGGATTDNVVNKAYRQKTGAWTTESVREQGESEE